MRTISEIDKEIAELEKKLENLEGRKTEVYTRIVGYYRSLRNWNRGKREEYSHRVLFDSDPTVEFAPGTVSVTQTVSYVPLDDLPTDGLAFALLPSMSFNRPVTVTIHYSDADVIGMDEESLKLYLYDWADLTWVDADPCGGYLGDPANNILQAAVCHFSDYALLDRPFRIYLPLIPRN